MIVDIRHDGMPVFGLVIMGSDIDPFQWTMYLCEGQRGLLSASIQFWPLLFSQHITSMAGISPKPTESSGNIVKFGSCMYKRMSHLNVDHSVSAIQLLTVFDF